MDMHQVIKMDPDSFVRWEFESVPISPTLDAAEMLKLVFNSFIDFHL